MLPFTSYLQRTPRIIVILLALFPVTLISNLAAFGPASALATAGCYLQAFALVAQLGIGDSDWHVPQKSVWTTFNFMGLLPSLPMICFVYAFHYVLTETLVELKRPTRMRMALVNVWSVFILLGCYVPVSVAGYLLYSGKNIESNVLTKLSPESPTVLIAKWSIGALLLITYSLFLIPLRQKLEKLLFGELTERMLDRKRVVVAALLNTSVAIVSVVLPNLGLANSLAGGCIALIMFYFPGQLMVKHQINLPFRQKNILHICVGCIFVFFGALICILGLFGGIIFDVEGEG